MPGLKDTIERLSRMRQPGDADGQASAMTATPDFGANPGALRMFSYVPEGLAPGAPLVVVLHGCTQRAADHAEGGGWLTLADRYGFVVVAPEQTTANNPNRCFNWYEPADTGRGRGEAASIRAMIAHAVREHGLDAERVFVTGLSAGGAMTSVMLATYPDTFAAGAVIAGLPYGVADNVQEALGAMYAGHARSSADLGSLLRNAAPAGARLPRVSIWHGAADHTVRPHNAVDIARQWTAAHGLAEEPDETQALPGRTRLVWRSPATGEVEIESILVHGLGHGTPLSTGGPEGVGTAGPYMLEAGVSSSLEVARFWGIAPLASEETPAAEAEPQAAHSEQAAQPAGAASRPQGLGEQVLAAVSPHVAPEVEATITQALKTAGLMR